MKQMKKSVEAKAAFEIWNKIIELENILWDHYYETFLDLILDKEEREIINGLKDDLDSENPFV